MMNDLLRPDALPIALALSVTLERIWEYFAKPLVEQAPPHWQPILNRYGPAIVALCVCAMSGLTITTPAIHPLADTIITGLLIGGGSNLVHDITQR